MTDQHDHDDGADDSWTDDGWSDDGSDPAADPRAQAGLDHLQRAAHELIAASRAFLDVAEGLVEDPAAVTGLVDLLGAMGGRAARLGRAAVGPTPRPGREQAPGEEGGDDDGDSPVERIPVS